MFQQNTKMMVLSLIGIFLSSCGVQVDFTHTTQKHLNKRSKYENAAIQKTKVTKVQTTATSEADNVNLEIATSSEYKMQKVKVLGSAIGLANKDGSSVRPDELAVSAAPSSFGDEMLRELNIDNSLAAKSQAITVDVKNDRAESNSLILYIPVPQESALQLAAGKSALYIAFESEKDGHKKMKIQIADKITPDGRFVMIETVEDGTYQVLKVDMVNVDSDPKALEREKVVPKTEIASISETEHNQGSAEKVENDVSKPDTEAQQIQKTFGKNVESVDLDTALDTVSIDSNKNATEFDVKQNPDDIQTLSKKLIETEIPNQEDLALTYGYSDKSHEGRIWHVAGFEFGTHAAEDHPIDFTSGAIEEGNRVILRAAKQKAEKITYFQTRVRLDSDTSFKIPEQIRLVKEVDNISHKGGLRSAYIGFLNDEGTIACHYRAGLSNGIYTFKRCYLGTSILDYKKGEAISGVKEIALKLKDAIFTESKKLAVIEAELEIADTNETYSMNQ